MKLNIDRRNLGFINTNHEFGWSLDEIIEIFGNNIMLTLPI